MIKGLDHHVAVSEKRRNGFRSHDVDHSAHVQIGIDGPQVVPEGHHLGLADLAGEEELPVEVAGLDGIVIHKSSIFPGHHNMMQLYP